MGVKVEDEWQFKRVRSENASKSAFAFQINNKLKLKEQSRVSHGFSVKAPYSREVIVKITGGAKSKKGIRSTVEYISKDWQEEIVDSNGIKYKIKEEMTNAVSTLQENVLNDTNATLRKELKLTHNIVFSPPRGADVKKEEAFKATVKALTEKYPNNYFVAAYHEETGNPHVHVVLNIHSNTGERINIRKKDLRDIREGYCKNLIEYGYDVKASRKYENEKYIIKAKHLEELASRENRNTYEVVDFGTASYQLDKKNDKNNYLVYKTSNNKEAIIWGKGILSEITNKNIKKGDFIKIKKIGYMDVKVPVYAADGATVVSWKVVKRNCWNIEKAGDNFNLSKTEYPKEIRLNSALQAAKQLEQREKFNHEKKLLVDVKYKEDFELKQKLKDKRYKQSLTF